MLPDSLIYAAITPDKGKNSFDGHVPDSSPLAEPEEGLD
jgi:hypothetical protein